MQISGSKEETCRGFQVTAGLVHLRDIKVYGVAKQKQAREKVMGVEVLEVGGMGEDAGFLWLLW